MWANQDWVDVHPAKKGWHSTYRVHPTDPTCGPVRVPSQPNQPSGSPPNRSMLTPPGPVCVQNVTVGQLQMFDAFMSPEVFRNAFGYVSPGTDAIALRVFQRTTSIGRCLPQPAPACCPWFWPLSCPPSSQQHQLRSTK